MDSIQRQLPITTEGSTTRNKRNGNSQILLKAIWMEEK